MKGSGDHIGPTVSASATAAAAASTMVSSASALAETLDQKSLSLRNGSATSPVKSVRVQAGVVMCEVSTETRISRWPERLNPISPVDDRYAGRRLIGGSSCGSS